MATEKASVEVTGGAGFECADSVAARFLLDMLLARCSVAADLGAVEEVHWENRESGWLADDVVLLCRNGGSERAVGLSIKSNKQVSSNGFPLDFVQLAWEQWLGLSGARRIKDTSDEIGLVVGELADGVAGAWQKTAIEARETTPERMLARLVRPSEDDPGAQSSELQRALVESLHCPDALKTGDETTASATIELLRRLNLIHFDFDSIQASDRVVAIRDCQGCLAAKPVQQGETLWIRLRDVAGRKRAVGGSITRAELVEELRGEFALTDHPDFAADWTTVSARSAELMEEVQTEVQGLGTLARDDEFARVRKRLDEYGSCVIVGDSGCGKSSLAKIIATTHYGRSCWLTAGDLALPDMAALSNLLCISRPLADVLCAAPAPCLLVVDALESADLRAMARIRHLLGTLRTRPGSAHVRVLVTTQPDGLARTLPDLAASGISQQQVVTLSRPPESDVGALVRRLPSLSWTALRPNVRPLLTNLKILDWVARAVAAGEILDANDVVNESALIDWIWVRWLERGADALSRSSLVIELATKEGASLLSGVPRTQIGHPEQHTLQGLLLDGTARRRDERVFLSHDLLGDWARCKFLVAEASGSPKLIAERAALPRWHRAIRLYGQWMLERHGVGLQKWREVMRSHEDGSTEGTVVCDLLLESLFMASNARGVMNDAWPELIADEGALLRRMLERFYFAGSIPDPRIAEVLKDPAQIDEIGHLLRYPLWIHWGPMLETLCDHLPDVIALAPLLASKIAVLWLSRTPTRFSAGQQYPWRAAAARLAVFAAREVQCQYAEGAHFRDNSDRVVFEALLQAAPDETGAVVELCLELARRRDVGEAVRKREDAARASNEVKRQQFEADHPDIVESRKALLTRVLPRGRMLGPWPDGPREDVIDSFRSACLDPAAFIALVRAAPDAALETLLAVCIEEPKEENVYGDLMHECGTAYWREGYPPMHSRGPFLSFLKEAPDQGVEFIIRLVNFATERRIDSAMTSYRARGGLHDDTPPGIELELENQPLVWSGDEIVYGWHCRFSQSSDLVASALMALERYLYDEIEAGRDVRPLARRLIFESQSLAFAGLLVAVGKRDHSLFGDVLRPLLACHHVYQLDLSLVCSQVPDSPLVAIVWGGQPAPTLKVVQEWFSMPHRRVLLRDLAIQLLLSRSDMREFFATVTPNWIEIGGQDLTSSARILAERLTPANYSVGDPIDQKGALTINFRYPAAIEQALEPDRVRSQQAEIVMGIPLRCRKLLDAGSPLERSDAEGLWNELQRVECLDANVVGDDTNVLYPASDSICGGVAVLLQLAPNWLREDSSREAWCRQQLLHILEATDEATFFGSEWAFGNHHTDSFAAECGVALLRSNASDDLGRRLVARGILADRTDTIGLTMSRAFACRGELGEDFGRLQNLVARWAGLRSLIEHAKYLRADFSKWREEGNALAVEFVVGDGPVVPTPLLSASERTRECLAQLEREHLPEEVLARPEASFRRLALDFAVVQSAFAWLDLGAADGNAEAYEWTERLREITTLTVEVAPKGRRNGNRGDSAVPSEPLSWGLRIAAHNLVLVENDAAESLWKPVLGLGAAAHYWVDSFCSQFLRSSVRVCTRGERVAELWSRMIRFSLGHHAWDAAKVGGYDLARIVVALLGFGPAGLALARHQNGSVVLSAMLPAIQDAAARWFGLPTVARDFVSFAGSLGPSPLLIEGLVWVDGVAEAAAEDDDFDERLVPYLRACWLHERSRIVADSPVRERFLRLAAGAVARGSDAAASLRDQVSRPEVLGS